MTGITRVSKESIFSDLNNLEVVTTTSAKYTDVFGFTEAEVEDALREYGIYDRKDEVKKWYDGFRFGDETEIYNPWSIINFLDKQSAEPYWANTSSNRLISNLIQKGTGQVKETLDFRLGFIDFARVHFISALHGSGVGNLFESVREAYDSSTRRVGTSMLTRIMTMAVEDHQPPLVRGRRVKLKYAHAGGYNPPIVVIHGNQVKDLPDSYKRYLMNYFRKSLDVMGSPIRIQFKEGENPYANKRNTLTPTQMRKRKRLMKHIKKSK